MQPRSALCVLPRDPSFRTRAGQQQFLNLYASNPPQECVGQCPTGYGKTIIAALAFRELVVRKKVTRLLFIVAGEQQAKQAAQDFGKDCNLIGLQGVECWRWTNNSTSVLAASRGDANVFIVTVQTVSASCKGSLNLIDDLLSSGDWFVVCDEFHHFGDGQAWGDAILSVRRKAKHTLALSATPYNRSAATVFGAPNIKVTYQSALEEKAVKPFELKAAKYTVTFEDRNHETEEMTTCELRDNQVDDKHVRRRQLRVINQYIEPLLRRAVNNLISKRASLTVPGIRLQMLIRVHACYMAEKVAETIREFTDGYTVDWVGTGDYGRTDEENSQVMARFVPSKDANGHRKQPELDILVQVGMCSEGADTVNVVEVVDLSLSTYTEPAVGDRQFVGRGARVIKKDGELVNVVCTVWVPSDSAIAKLAGNEKFRAWLDAGTAPERDEDDENDEAEEGERDITIDTNLIRVRKVSLEEILEGDRFPKFVELSNKKNNCNYDLSNPESLKAAMAVFEACHKITSEERNKQDELAENKRRLTEQVNHFSNRMFRALQTGGAAVDAKANGLIIRAVRTHLITVTGLNAEQMTRPEDVQPHLEELSRLATRFNDSKRVPDFINCALRRQSEGKA